jgi:hypothetical protein
MWCQVRIGLRILAGLLAAVVVAGLVSVANAGTSAHRAAPRGAALALPGGRAPALDTLAGVSCVSASFCLAVGTSFGGPTHKGSAMLAETWNGRRWRLMPGSPLRSRPAAVSCPSRSFCMAVGQGQQVNLPLVRVWDGRTWRLLKSPAHADLAAVSCPDSSFCMAVGPQTAEVWNGRTWRLLTVPDHAALTGVSCPSTSFCLATGYSAQRPGSPIMTQALVWNGAGLRSTHPPDPRQHATLTAVSCADASRCTVLGYRGGCLGCFLAATWNGRTWEQTIRRLPVLTALSCPDAHHCVAVGNCAGALNCRHGQAALAWNGSSWRPVTAAGPGYASLNGVSCWHPRACMTVGNIGQSPLPFAVPAPPASSPASPRHRTVTRTTNRTLAERWNGTTWQILPTPSP